MSKDVKFLIAAPSYSPNSGGAMVLHHLCHLINEIGQASVVPMPRGAVVNWLNIQHIDKIIQEEKRQLSNFNVAPELNTPIHHGKIDPEFTVAVYPEVVFGNPFQLKHVARWILYHSGFHRRMNCTSQGEIEFKFNEDFIGSTISGFSSPSDIILNIVLPNEVDFKMLKNRVNGSAQPENNSRVGTAFCIRKGKFQKHRLINEDSICVDNEGIDKIREIMQTVEYFVSFDPQTYLSNLAVVCGCKSVVVDPDVCSTDIETLKKLHLQRPWLAYSDDQISGNSYTQRELLSYFETCTKASRKNVKNFVNFWRSCLNQ